MTEPSLLFPIRRRKRTTSFVRRSSPATFNFVLLKFSPCHPALQLISCCSCTGPFCHFTLQQPLHFLHLLSLDVRPLFEDLHPLISDIQSIFVVILSTSTHSFLNVPCPCNSWILLEGSRRDHSMAEQVTGDNVCRLLS